MSVSRSTPTGLYAGGAWLDAVPWEPLVGILRPSRRGLFRDSPAVAILGLPPGYFFIEFQRVTVSNPESSDTHFFNSFSLVLGILIVFAIILFGVARSIGADTQGKDVLLDPLHTKEVQQNIEPFAHEAIAGKDNSALAVVTAPAGAGAGVPTTGEQAFTQVCSACHSTGVNGAPKIGDHAAWGPRIAQGKEVLYKDAIGGKGNMPPKGGTTWPDATIRMTVDYMVSLNSK